MADLMTRLADAAVEWNKALVFSRELKGERNAIECERLMSVLGLESYLPDAPLPEQVPCWKAWKHDRTGEGFDRDAIPTWCESCQKRQALTDTLRAVNKKRGARLREMRRLAGLCEQKHAEIREHLTAALARTV